MAEGAVQFKYVSIDENRRDWAYAPSGVPVWAIIGQLRALNWEVEEYLARTGGEITREDVDFSLQYYEAHRIEINHKLLDVS